MNEFQCVYWPTDTLTDRLTYRHSWSTDSHADRCGDMTHISCSDMSGLQHRPTDTFRSTARISGPEESEWAADRPLQNNGCRPVPSVILVFHHQSVSPVCLVVAGQVQ